MKSAISRQDASAGPHRAARRGVVDQARREFGALRCWLAWMVMLGLCLPMLVPALVTLCNVGGEHEVRCAFGDNRVQMTLHHTQVPAATGRDMVKHRHTWLEKALVGDAGSGHEPDHQLDFNCQRMPAGQDDEVLRELVAWIDLSWPVAVAPVDWPASADHGPAGPPWQSLRGLSPPQVARRGVMMRV